MDELYAEFIPIIVILFHSLGQTRCLFFRNAYEDKKCIWEKVVFIDLRLGIVLNNHKN